MGGPQLIDALRNLAVALARFSSVAPPAVAVSLETSITLEACSGFGGTVAFGTC